MKREIKFRCWDFQNLRWATNNDVVESIGLEFDREAYFLRDGDKHSSRWDFQQYTGLKDKNGKEIYEGDIIASGKELKPRGEVLFKNGCFIWAADQNPLTQDGLETIDTELWAEVIGNIYENPELLTNVSSIEI